MQESGTAQTGGLWNARPWLAYGTNAAEVYIPERPEIQPSLIHSRWQHADLMVLENSNEPAFPEAERRISTKTLDAEATDSIRYPRGRGRPFGRRPRGGAKAR